MASKFGMAGGIPERRVRPIWDAVDSRQFKSALKLSTALLAKYPNSPYALALKALILERMGKPDEAISVCINAKEQLYSDDMVHIDDLTLSTLQIVFQRLDRLDLATSCYEYACGKFPNNLEVMMGLFNCYVREYAYVKQQQTAIKMYKVAGEERFLLWAVCSFQLQVFSGDGGEKLLLLAEALIKKHIALHSLHEPEALLVYISVLEQQAKYEAALEILSGKLGSLLVIEGDRLRIQGRLLARAHDYAAAAEIFRKVIESCPDDWESYLNYIGCLLEDDSGWCRQTINDPIHLPNSVDFNACELSHLTDEVFDSRMSIALCFVQNLQTDTNNEYVRGPYLANLEIEKRRRLHRKADDCKLMEVLLNYFGRFGHLACFTSDVEMFVQVLTDNEKTMLLEEVAKICGDSSSTLPIKKMGQVITHFKLEELVGTMFSLSTRELEGTAMQMVDMYCHSLPFSRDLDPQENMYGEELLTMACNVLVQLFWRTKDLGYLLEAVMVLEFGLTIRRYVWQYKIHVLHIYSHLGALPSAYEWYKTLEVKNILQESVLHHILPQMLRSPLWSDSADLLSEYLKFMDDHFREAPDLTFLAYRHRNYTKVIEFVQFRERLQHSHQYLMARLDAPILHLKQKADNLEEIECIFEDLNCGTQLLELSSGEQSKSLTFNEDMQSRPWWSPSSDENYLLDPFEGSSFSPREKSGTKQAREREASLRKAVERRSLLPRLIFLSIRTASSLKDTVYNNGPIYDNKSSSELKCLLEQYAQSLGFSFDDSLKVIAGISGGHRSFKDLSSDMVDWMNFAVFMNAWNLCSHVLEPLDGDNRGLGSWGMVGNLIEKCTAEQLEYVQPLLTCPGSNLPTLVQLVTESFTWHCLVIYSCIRSLIPSGKKKKKSGTAGQSQSPLLKTIRGSLELLYGSLEKITRWLKGQINGSEDEKLDTLFSFLQRNGPHEGPGRVLQILESAASIQNPEVGERISQALQMWSSADVAGKVIKGQNTVLFEFHRICELKLKAMQALKQLI
ncbi:tetratricopeptide repeat (TPR)-like superfamily protein [Tasmannia lanceolata]|uniref:tetratricopeptide repeat (TPR)-like superfamily protein n=1 Tax=Tasmannia lanceolata TaxID=3420 RepID=UPI004063A852